ncbi:FAD-dependent oxidoreductase [Acrocarpospora catenulata]|uniref:FAD-dependent oxidoreductase n=1 Tax=Acrocarpospora catenulata TaxID=2836182 RepID=UPI001BDA53EB|nr:NAD(P)/FAD-dependent oxidoreductase [Acrocarpospora catenulata]
MTDPSTGRSNSNAFHVLIIGAGIGGLCLAQGLTRSGISVAVYERDTSAEFRDQGYRIGLKEAGAQALHHCLPPHLFDLCVATSIRQATRMVFTDEQLTPKFAKPVPPVEPGQAGFGVNRLTLREILLAGLDGVVHFGKTFRHYEQLADGRVLAHFADGTSATADLLVGADGTNSAVRRQLVPDAVVDELHWAVYGRTPIADGTLDWVPDVLVDTFNRVIGPAGAAFAVATCRPREPVAAAAARLAPGLRLTDQPGYFSWTMPLLDDSLRTADAATLHQAARAMVDGWHPAVRRLIAEADVAATFPVCITSARPVPPWDSANTTLLGDAIHTMSPGRGEGANIALKDARLLRDALTEVAAGRVPLSQAKQHYEAEMLRYGFEAVAASLHQPFAPAARGGAKPA